MVTIIFLASRRHWSWSHTTSRLNHAHSDVQQQHRSTTKHNISPTHLRRAPEPPETVLSTRFNSPPCSLYQRSSTGAHQHQPHAADGNVVTWPTAMMAAFCAIDNERSCCFCSSCCSALRRPQPHATNLLPAANNMAIISFGKRMQRHNAADEETIFKNKATMTAR